MAARTETLGRTKAMSASAWSTLVAATLLAVALAVGGYALTRSSEPVTAPKVEQVTTTATYEGGLIKNGLQPRPFSMIAAPAAVTGTDTPTGFIRVGTDFRPMPVVQQP